MTNDLVTTLIVNRQPFTYRAPGHLTLLRWLRDVAGIYDVKYGCGEGVCGACTVLVDGSAVSSCLTLAIQVDGATVETASSLLEPGGLLGDLQKAFLECGAAQCGFCTPGMIMAAHELLSNHKELDRRTIREELHGNLCRCSGYQAIVDAVERAAWNRVVAPG